MKIPINLMRSSGDNAWNVKGRGILPISVLALRVLAKNRVTTKLNDKQRTKGRESLIM